MPIISQTNVHLTEILKVNLVRIFSLQITDILNAQKLDVNANQEQEKGDLEKSVMESSERSHNDSADFAASIHKGTYFEKVAERKKNWEYFEINHPKAISDQRLQQLKAKYQKRKTEEFEKVKNINTVEEFDEDAVAETSDTVVCDTLPVANLKLSSTRGAHRSQSVPLFCMEPQSSTTKMVTSGGELDLSVDPMTGLCLAARSNEMRKEPSITVEEVTMRKLSSDSDSSGSRRSSRRRSSHLADIAEQSVIPDEKILEVRIDPLTSQVEALEVPR